MGGVDIGGKKKEEKKNDMILFQRAQRIFFFKFWSVTFFLKNIHTRVDIKVII